MSLSIYNNIEAHNKWIDDRKKAIALEDAATAEAEKYKENTIDFYFSDDKAASLDLYGYRAELVTGRVYEISKAGRVECGTVRRIGDNTFHALLEHNKTIRGGWYVLEAYNPHDGRVLSRGKDYTRSNELGITYAAESIYLHEKAAKMLREGKSLEDTGAWAGKLGSATIKRGGW